MLTDLAGPLIHPFTVEISTRLGIENVLGEFLKGGQLLAQSAIFAKQGWAAMRICERPTQPFDLFLLSLWSVVRVTLDDPSDPLCRDLLADIQLLPFVFFRVVWHLHQNEFSVPSIILI